MRISGSRADVVVNALCPADRGPARPAGVSAPRASVGVSPHISATRRSRYRTVLACTNSARAVASSAPPASRKAATVSSSDVAGLDERPVHVVDQLRAGLGVAGSARSGSRSSARDRARGAPGQAGAARSPLSAARVTAGAVGRGRRPPGRPRPARRRTPAAARWRRSIGSPTPPSDDHQPVAVHAGHRVHAEPAGRPVHRVEHVLGVAVGRACPTTAAIGPVVAPAERGELAGQRRRRPRAAAPARRSPAPRAGRPTTPRLSAALRVDPGGGEGDLAAEPQQLLAHDVARRPARRAAAGCSSTTAMRLPDQLDGLLQRDRPGHRRAARWRTPRRSAAARRRASAATRRRTAMPGLRDERHPGALVGGQLAEPRQRLVHPGDALRGQPRRSACSMRRIVSSRSPARVVTRSQPAAAAAAATAVSGGGRWPSPAIRSPTCGRSRSCSSARTSRPTGCGRSAPRPSTRRASCRADELAARVAAGTLTELNGRRRRDRALRRRVAARRGAGLPAPAAGHRGRRRSTTATAALRAALRGDCHAHSDWSDGGSPIREMAQAARDLGHEYLVLTDHSPRLTVANGLSAERLAQQLDVVAELNEPSCAPVPHPHRHRGRHPRGRHARPEAVAARPARRRRRERALEAADAGGRDDPADGRRDRQPAHRRPRPLHRPAGHGRRAAPGRSRSSTPRSSSPRARSSASRSRSTPGPSGSTRRSGCCGWRSRPAACSRSTPTRTPRASSTGRPTAASARSQCGVDAATDRQHLAGRATCSRGRPTTRRDRDRDPARE